MSSTTSQKSDLIVHDPSNTISGVKSAQRANNRNPKWWSNGLFAQIKHSFFPTPIDDTLTKCVNYYPEEWEAIKKDLLKSIDSATPIFYVGFAGNHWDQERFVLNNIHPDSIAFIYSQDDFVIEQIKQTFPNMTIYFDKGNFPQETELWNILLRHRELDAFFNIDTFNMNWMMSALIKNFCIIRQGDNIRILKNLRTNIETAPEIAATIKRPLEKLKYLIGRDVKFKSFMTTPARYGSRYHRFMGYFTVTVE